MSTAMAQVGTVALCAAPFALATSAKSYISPALLANISMLTGAFFAGDIRRSGVSFAKGLQKGALLTSITIIKGSLQPGRVMQLMSFMSVVSSLKSLLERGKPQELIAGDQFFLLGARLGEAVVSHGVEMVALQKLEGMDVYKEKSDIASELMCASFITGMCHILFAACRSNVPRHNLILYSCVVSVAMLFLNRAYSTRIPDAILLVCLTLGVLGCLK